MTEKFYLTFEKKFLVFGETEKTLKVLDGNFDFDIEETANFGTRGLNVVVVSNAKGEKLFLKKGQTDKFGNVELDPLSASEIQEYGIVQETCQNDRYYVQETEATETNSTKKKVRFDPNTAEDMRKAKSMLRTSLHVSEKDRVAESLKEENEDLREKLKLIATKELNARLKANGLGQVNDFASESDAVQALRNVEHKAPEGGNQNFYHYQEKEPSQKTLNQAFNSDAEMLAELEKRAKSDDLATASEAQATLDAIKHRVSERVKAESKGLDLTFEGKIVDLAMLPRPQTPKESNEDYQAYLKRWRQSRTHWVDTRKGSV